MKKISYILVCIALIYSQNIRVCLLDQKTQISFKFSGNYILQAEEAKYQFTKLNAPFFVYAKNGQIILESKGEYKRYLKFLKSSRLILYPQHLSGSVLINKKFREAGRIYITMNLENKIEIITKKNIESYLKYVVPYEILTGSKSDFEAIKAQTIAARTYALSHVKTQKSFDVYSDVRDQVYISKIEPNDRVLRAIEETRGKIIQFKGKIIPAHFCASLGGQQEYPLYLDKKDENYIFSVADKRRNEIFGKLDKYYRWAYKYSYADIFQRLKKWFPNDKIDTDERKDLKFSLEIIKRSKAGRAVILRIRGVHFEKKIRKLDIRRFFSSNGKILPSNLFVLKKNKSELIIQGGGNGHGYGMGQWEAIELARKKYTYIDIIEFFYPQTQLGEL